MLLHKIYVACCDLVSATGLIGCLLLEPTCEIVNRKLLARLWTIEAKLLFMTA
eukprot:m.162119 g.162119  ORF g.162119 m.162119 type:complete len:53 (-) comp15196_c0_seq3:1503-1661(-)